MISDTKKEVHKRHKRNDIKQYKDFRGYIEALPSIVEEQIALKGSHHIPQTCYTHVDGEFICDYVGKFEELPT